MSMRFPLAAVILVSSMNFITPAFGQNSIHNVPLMAPVSFADTAYRVNPFETNLNGIVAADFNGNGNLDLVVTNNGGLTVVTGDGHGRFVFAARTLCLSRGR